MTRVHPSSTSPLALGAALVAVLAALLLVPVGTASAHDQLTGSEPADGATVQQAPEEVVLTFSGEVAQVGAQVLVTGPDGGTVSEGDAQVEGTAVTQALQAALPAGVYEVTWRVTSQDGHPISGTFGFEATEAAGGETAEETGAEATSADETSAEGTSAAESGAEETTPAPTTTDAGDDASITAQPDESDEMAGLPGWVWPILVLAAVALVVVLVRASGRGRKRDDR